MKSPFKLLERVEGKKKELSPLWNLLLNIPGADLALEPMIPKIPACLKFNPAFFYFCLQNLPIAEILRHLCVIGMPGSGKTVLIKLLVKSLVSSDMDSSIKRRIIYFDAKGDGVSFFSSLGLRPENKNVWILDPFDERSCIWDIAESVQDPSMAFYVADLLSPKEPNSNSPFFPDGARILVFCVILGLNASRGTKWTFRDLLCALHSVANIRAVAALDALANMLCQLILEDDKHSPSIISTITTKVTKFSQVAALTSVKKNRRVFSIKEFLKSSGILIVRFDPVLRDSLNPYNSLILKALSDELLRGAETFDPHTFFVFDEMLTLGRADEKNTVADLMEFGRSKGVSVTVGIQSIAAMYEAFGEHNTNRLLGLAAHKTFLRTGDTTTAKWCEEYFNKIRTFESTFTKGWSKSGASGSVNYALKDRPMLLGSVFRCLPFPRRGGDFYAISDVPAFNCVLHSKRSFDELLSWGASAVNVANFIPWEKVSMQRLLPWTEKERLRICKIKSPMIPTPVAEPAPEEPYLPKFEKPGDEKFTDMGD